jgi:hypothetical protein
VSTQRPNTSYNEAIGLAADAAVKFSSALMAEPPVPDWRKRQDRLNWVNSQDFGAVASELGRPTATRAPVHTCIVGRTYHERIGLDAHASVECIGVRLRESPLPWRRVRQILLNFFRREKT